jgi:hypothetical protein
MTRRKHVLHEPVVAFQLSDKASWVTEPSGMSMVVSWQGETHK